MSDNFVIDVLNRLLHDTVNSVTQYAEISAPYIPEGMDEELQGMQRVADEEKLLAGEIVAMIGTRDGVPQVGVFPYWNVDLNYLDVRFMAKFAVEHQDEAITRLEGELEMVRDDPEVHAFLKKAIEQKREHRELLDAAGKDYAT